MFVPCAGVAQAGDDSAVLPARVLADSVPGQVLDPDRILVASSSIFGATLPQSGSAAASVLSYGPTGPAPVIPPDLATGGYQEAALDGRIRLYAAQSTAFCNALDTPGAATPDYLPVSNPLGVSINNDDRDGRRRLVPPMGRPGLTRRRPATLQPA